MRRSGLLIIAVIVIVLASMAGAVLAQQDASFIRGEPSLSAHAPEPTLSPGSTNQLTLQVSNDGEITAGAPTQRDLVTTARNVRVDVDDDDVPFTVVTQRQSLSSIPDGTAREFPVTVRVPADVEPGEYTLDIELRYSYTYQFAPRSSVVQERSRTVTRSVTVSVDDRPRMALRGVDSDVQVGDAGTVTAKVENVGATPARDLSVVLESTSSNVLLGGNTSETVRVDELAPGEATTIAYDVAVRDGTSVSNYSLDGHVRFTDDEGIQHVDEGLSIGLSPLDEQAFTIEVGSSTLRPGEPGVIRGTIRNDGPVAVDDVVLTLGEGQFEPRSPSHAIGLLDVGSSSAFVFRGHVPREADAVPQQLDVLTEYRTAADNERAKRDSIYVSVAERRDAVTVTAIEPQFAAGEEGTLELEVTNQRDVEIRDVRLHLGVQEPLESDFRSTVVPSLQPGEAERVAFDLEIDSDAPISRYPATVEIEYTDPDDDPATVRPATVAIEVTETDEEFFEAVEFLIFGIMLLLVIVAFVWLYRR